MTAVDFVKNPFFVLELDAEASAVDVDRQGKKLLAEMELGRSTSSTFPSPYGRQRRDEAAVRAAMSTLRDPRLRELYALFVPPRDRWTAAADEIASSSSRSATGHAYPELADVAPARTSWLRALLRGPA